MQRLSLVMYSPASRLHNVFTGHAPIPPPNVLAVHAAPKPNGVLAVYAASRLYAVLDVHAASRPLLLLSLLLLLLSLLALPVPDGETKFPNHYLHTASFENILMLRFGKAVNGDHYRERL